MTLSDGQSTSTKNDGWFEFAGVDEGLVDLTVNASGYGTENVTKEIAAGLTNWNSVALNPSSSSSGSSGGTTASSSGSHSPTDWETVFGPQVTLSWPDNGSPVYQVEIWYHDGSDWYWYYTYTDRADTQTFWPVVDDAYYVWSVRSWRSGWSNWSALNYFWFEN